MSPHSTPMLCGQRGLTLIESLVSLALLASLSTWSLPGLQTWVLRARLEATREAWLNDLQTARAQALQADTEVSLTRRTDCAWLGDSRDWSCGWQLSRTDAATPLAITLLRGDVLVQFSSSDRLRINARGEPMSAGANIKFRAPNTSDGRLSSIVCLNIAGRWHVQSGETCS
jgi:prepilin-type N-terminal cleavage/methylation domain-containing protein